ncbi:hypothetical protein GCM10027421_31130 [Microbacterium shaanxiense]
MRTLTVRRSPAPILLAATLLAAVLVLFAWPQPAAAHDALIDSNPAADSTVETLPDELSLTFSAALIGGDGSTDVVVTDAEGNDVTDGEATLDGAMVVQPLASGGTAGQYHVIWKVVSSDGHPTSGEFGFSVSTGAAGDAPPAAEPTTEPEETTTAAPTVPADEDPSMTSGFSISAPWIIGGAVVLLIAAFIIFMVIRGRRGSSEPRSDSDAPAER